jgi:hypothetical protein
VARSRVLRPPPTPLHVDARLVIAVGTALWAVGAIVLAIGWTWVDDHNHELWLWTSLAGTGLGLLGLLLMGKHRSEGRF